MGLIVANVYIFAMAVVLAEMEIQIEGENGWAAKLPTWRPSWMPKHLTGYHIALFVLLMMFFQFPFVMGIPLSLVSETKILSLFLLFATFWDFLWFVLNPHFMLKRFKPSNIPWHGSWVMGIPVDYYVGVIGSLLVILPDYFLNNDPGIIAWWGMNLGLFLMETILVISWAKVFVKSSD